MCNDISLAIIKRYGTFRVYKGGVNDLDEVHFRYENPRLVVRVGRRVTDDDVAACSRVAILVGAVDTPVGWGAPRISELPAAPPCQTLAGSSTVATTDERAARRCRLTRGFTRAREEGWNKEGNKGIRGKSGRGARESELTN